VDAMNSRQASFETIKKFYIVPRDFTQENDEMTPTLKIKRKVVTERYKEQIDKLYAK
jgi:long-chain acyl-CoA synthetase